MYHPLNPYITNKPVGNSPAFIGHADKLREVERMLHNPDDNAIVLYGQRHIGKTSMLQHLTAQLLTYEKCYPIYFDLQNKATWYLGEVINELAKSIAQALNQAVPDLGEQPETEFFDLLFNMIQNLPENSTVVLLFDEFDVLAEPKEEQAGAALFPYLRLILKNCRHTLKFIFAIGRNVDDIDNIAVYLFRGIPPIKRLSLLSQKEMEKLVRLSEVEANNSLNWQKEAVTSVWRYTQGHPFLTQQICFHVWEHIYQKAPDTVPAVTPTDVENVIVEVLDVSRKTLEWLWEGLPPAGRVVASALAEAGAEPEPEPEPMTEQALETWFYENGIRVLIQELQEMPHMLQEWDWLALTDMGYVFRVELLRRWLTENKPFRRIQNEIDCVDPVADSLFRAALDLYKKEQFDASIKQLREAIGLNPNHLGAQQLLADILLAQGKTGEAKQLLEKLYNYKPLVARSRLIQALLDLAQQSKRDAEKLEWYEQVLKLEPKQPEALAKRREIWRLRGDKALAKEDFKAALKFYKKLGISDQVAEIEQKIRERYFNFRDDFDSFKKKKHFQIFALAILVLVSGIWAYWIQPLKGISPQQLEEAQAKTAKLDKALEQAHMEKAQFEKALEQAQVEKAQFEKEVKKAQAKQAHMEKAFEQAKLAMIEVKKERATFFQRTEFGGFLSKLEKGDQVVIVASYQARYDADEMLEKLNAAYPELFYHQAALLPENIENNIYQRGKLWEIFISGFYSYTSAKALAKKLKTLDLIMDAFVRKDPFRDRRQLPWS